MPMKEMSEDVSVNLTDLNKLESANHVPAILFVKSAMLTLLLIVKNVWKTVSSKIKATQHQDVNVSMDSSLLTMDNS